MMDDLVLRIAYDGSRFFGSQLQPDVETVQGCIERALESLVHVSPPRVILAGRTDRGVHATGQVVAVRGGVRPPPEVCARLLDKRCAPALRVTAWTLGRPGFNPRRDALERRYIYLFRRSDGPSPFRDPYTLAMPPAADLHALRTAARLFEGEHDFTCFATTPSQQVRLRRELRAIEIRESTDHVFVEFHARAFLRGQIRNIMGTLLSRCTGVIDDDEIKRLLRTTVKGTVPPPAAPTGLYLSDVLYPPPCFHGPFTAVHPQKKALDHFLYA